MTDSIQQIERLFNDLIELPEEKRLLELDLRASDPEMKKEVQQLLGVAADAKGFLSLSFDIHSKNCETTELDLLDKNLGNYKIIALIGQGGMGKVYLASRADGQYNQKVAIKILACYPSQIKLDRFITERQILADLNHPYIARLIDGGIYQNAPYFVMELVEGIPLNQYCAQNTLTLETKLNLICKICEGVDAAHQKLIVHRDLKPQNILITTNGLPKLLDFGIAKILNHSHNHAQTTTNQFILTPEYSAPEQICRGEITTATDVYALGILLYEVLTDKCFRNLDNVQISTMVKIISETPLVAPSTCAPSIIRNKITGDLDNIVLKALDPDSSKRYPSAGALAEDIQNYLLGQKVNATCPSKFNRKKRVNNRSSLHVAISGLFVMSLIFASVLFTYQWHIPQYTHDESSYTIVQSIPDTVVHETGKSKNNTTDSAELPTKYVEKIQVNEIEKNTENLHQAVNLAHSYRLSSLESGMQEKQSEAKKQVQICLTMLDSHSESEKEIADAHRKCSLTLAHWHNISGEPEKALVILESVKREMQTSTNQSQNSIKSEAVQEYANAKALQGYSKKALQLQKRAVALAKKADGNNSDRLRLLANAFHQLGNRYADVDKKQLAKQAYKKSLSLWQQELTKHPDDKVTIDAISLLNSEIKNKYF